MKRVRKKNGRFAKKSNPVRTRRRTKQARAKSSARKRPRRRRRRSNPGSAVVMAGNPHRRHSSRPRRRRRHAAHSNPHRRRRTIRRHSNPTRARGLAGLARIGFFGGLGIVAARVGGQLYTDHISATVIGTDGAADPTNWRNTLNEVVRLVAMGAFAIVLERAASKMRLQPMDRTAFVVGALAETSRQAVGVLVAHGSPTTDKKKYGLDGAAWVDDDGNVFQLDSATGEYVSMGLLVDQDDTDSMGMGEIVDAQDFRRRAA